MTDHVGDVVRREFGTLAFVGQSFGRLLAKFLNSERTRTSGRYRAFRGIGAA